MIIKGFCTTFCINGQMATLWFHDGHTGIGCLGWVLQFVSGRRRIAIALSRCTLDRVNGVITSRFDLLHARVTGDGARICTRRFMQVIGANTVALSCEPVV